MNPAVAGLIAMPTVSDGTEMENDFSAKLGKLDTIDAKALADKAVNRAKGNLGGEVPTTQACPVVFDPEAMSDLLQIFSDIFSSRTPEGPCPGWPGRKSQVIAAPLRDPWWTTPSIRTTPCPSISMPRAAPPTRRTSLKKRCADHPALPI